MADELADATVGCSPKCIKSGLLNTLRCVSTYAETQPFEGEDTSNTYTMMTPPPIPNVPAKTPARTKTTRKKRKILLSDTLAI